MIGIAAERQQARALDIFTSYFCFSWVFRGFVFNCFLYAIYPQENDSKRARAEKKAADEIKARLVKEKEIEGLAAQLEELRGEKERVHEVLEKNMRCVVKVPSGKVNFRSILGMWVSCSRAGEVLMRCAENRSRLHGFVLFCATCGWLWCWRRTRGACCAGGGI